jgi:outer membrane protein TolC
MSGCYNKTRSVVFVFIAGLMAVFAGCKTPQDYKEEADKDVYSILDQKWQEKFGYKANYKITDEPNSLEAMRMIPPSKIISLKRAVEMAIRFSRDYQTQKESLYLSALTLTGVRHEYAAQWFGTVDAAYEFNAGNEDTSVDTSAGVQKKVLLGDVMYISASLTSDWLRYLTGDPRTSLTSVLSATLSAPLWGVGEAKRRREDLTQSERDVLYAIRSFSFDRKDFVIDVIAAYYDVLQQRNSVDIQKASYQRLVDSTNQLRMEVEVGQRPAYDLGEAEQRLLTAEQNVVDRVQSYELALDRFKIRLALPTDIDVRLDPNELDVLADIGVSEPDYSAEDAIQMALGLRLDLANVRDRLDDAERQLILDAEGLGPQIDFVASADVTSYGSAPGSLPDTQITRLRFHEGEYSAGIVADLPLDRLDERNTYRASLINVQRQQRSYDQAVDDIKLQVRDSYRNLIQSAESYRIQKLGLELAQKRVEVEKLSLQYGRGTVRLLLDSEDALVEAQDAVLRALVNHRIAKLNFFRDVGILRVQPDGMLEQVKP